MTKEIHHCPGMNLGDQEFEGVELVRVIVFANGKRVSCRFSLSSLYCLRVDEDSPVGPKKNEGQITPHCRYHLYSLQQSWLRGSRETKQIPLDQVIEGDWKNYPPEGVLAPYGTGIPIGSFLAADGNYYPQFNVGESRFLMVAFGSPRQANKLLKAIASQKVDSYQVPFAIISPKPQRPGNPGQLRLSDEETGVLIHRRQTRFSKEFFLSLGELIAESGLSTTAMPSLLFPEGEATDSP